jgi:hypothetical protein
MIEIDTEKVEIEAVTPIVPRDDRTLRLVISKRPDERMCVEHQLVVDPHARTVSCERCKAALDPFDAIWEIAKRHERQFAWTKHRLKELNALEARVDDLKRRETLARARLRRAGGEVPQKHEQDEQLGGTLRARIEDGRIRVHFDKRWTAEQAREGGAELVLLAMKLEAGRAK